MFALVLLSASVSTVDFVTLKFQANEHPPLAISPHPVDSVTGSSTSRSKNHGLHYTSPDIQDIIFDALTHLKKHFKVQEKCFLDVTSV